MAMQRVTPNRQFSANAARIVTLLSILLLIGCDNSAIQLCGEYACVGYQSEQDTSGNSSTPRQCEAPGSIRDRAPRIINQLRQAQRSCNVSMSTNALSPLLRWDETLAAVSVAHTRDMAENRFESFVGSDGLSTADRVMQANVNASVITESIVTGPQTVAEVINTWLDINTDCQQLVNSQTTRVGMACAVANRTNDGPYWSLLLAGPDNQ